MTSPQQIERSVMNPGAVEPTHLPHPPDYLAGALLQSLSRPASRRLAWSTARTTVVGLFTFGLMPLLMLPRRFGQFTAYQRQQMWHLAEWMRLHTGRPEAETLRDETARLRASPLLTTIGPILFTFIAVATFAGHLAEASRQPGAMREFVYGWQLRADLLLPLIYVAALSAGYLLCHWLAVNEYAGRMSRFVERFNRLAAAEHLAPVQPPATQLGVSAGSVVLGVLFVLTGAVWGLPMLLAAAAQRRYIVRASTRLHESLAQRVRDLLRQRHPHMAHAIPVYIRHPCVNDRCSGSVPAGARYCPRCGTRAEARIDRVA
jgi:hypothetical protein